MQRSKVRIILHFAWATKHREHLLMDDVERGVHRCLVAQAEGLGCTVLAVGGTADHVHLVAKIPGAVSAARLMQQVKGVSSTVGRELTHGYFGWQDNYGVVSVSPKDQEVVVRYVLGQKEHHAAGTTWRGLEAYTEDAPEAGG